MYQFLKYIFLLALVLLQFDVGNTGINQRFTPENELIKKLYVRNLASVAENNSSSIYTAKKHKFTAVRVDEDLSEITSRNIKQQISNTKAKTINKENFPDFKGENKKSQITYLRVIFDNDIFDNTDYYYTNGAEIQIATELAMNSPLSNLLPAFGSSAYRAEGFFIRQNIYTPINPDASEIQFGDHPFSAFTAIGQFKEVYSANLRSHLKSSISFGVIGPASMGGKVQAQIHDIEPLGWENQIQNDFYVNYNISFAAKAYVSKLLEVSLLAKANGGTAFNNLGLGMNFRFGLFTPLIENELLNFNKSSAQKFKFWIFAGLNYNLVLYNAILQGGMFNGNSPYVISASDINNLLLESSVGLNFSYGRFALQLENLWHSPEFVGAKDFKYGRINLLIGLN